MKLFIKSKITTYKIKFIILKLIIKQRLQDNKILKKFKENLSLNLFRAMSKPDNAKIFGYILLPFYIITLYFPYLKETFQFIIVSLFNEIKDVIVDFYYGLKKILLFPWKILKRINKFLRSSNKYTKFITAIKLPLSIRLYRATKKFLGNIITTHIDYDWFCYMLSLYVVNYNYILMGREERWFSYDHQPASWDYNWLTILH